MDDDSQYDVVVVGAGTHIFALYHTSKLTHEGISGIAFSRFYLDVHPQARVVILEREDGPGGVWSRGKLV
jgi:cation diffusion facilitator CzcD-associated flavoprotein CzcO